MDKKTRKRGGINPSPEQIRCLRAKYNVSQAEAGALVYHSICTISHYELGKARMRQSDWELLNIKLEQKYGVKNVCV